MKKYLMRIRGDFIATASDTPAFSPIRVKSIPTFTISYNRLN